MVKKLLVIILVLVWAGGSFAIQSTKDARTGLQESTPFVWEWRFNAGAADVCFGADGCTRDYNVDEKYIDACRFLCETGGTSTKIQILTYGAGSGTVRMGVYEDDAGNPGDLLWEGTDQTYVADTWVSEAVTSLTPEAGTYYWLAFRDNSSGKIRWEAGGATGCHEYALVGSDTYSDPFPDPWVLDRTNTNYYCIELCVEGGAADVYSGKFPRGVARGIVR